MYYIYILECNDGTYYTGYTTHIERRLAMHNQGKGAKYTRGRRPVSLIYWESFDEKSKALKREYEIKQMSRSKKEALVKRGLRGEKYEA